MTKIEAKDTFFYKKTTLNCRGKILDLSAPVVMGILNLTPDSFFDGGRYESLDAALAQAERMIREGASIIDAGAASTRPGARQISEGEELDRLIPVLEALHGAFPETVISADTYRSNVASAAVKAGASILNDISGGTFDPSMFETAGRLGVPYILMHIQGSPATMQQNPVYENVVAEVMDYFTEKITSLKSHGVKDIILDPGFGFGKNVEHNFSLLRSLGLFKILDYPILAGVSRKSMINKVLHTKPENALNGTTVLNTAALLHGAKILRVHDVKEAIQAIKLVEQLTVSSKA